MKNLSTRVFAIILIFFISFISCSKDDSAIDPGSDPNGLTFQNVINSGGSVNSPNISHAEDTTNIETNLPIGDGTFNCTTVTYDINAASGGSSGFPLFDVRSDVIYPGSMLQGNSLNSGNPNPIVVERAGGNISINILDGNLQSSFEVNQVKKSTITDAINNIINSATGTLPSNFNIKIESIQSREQFALALGVDVNSTFVDLESNLNYNSDSERSTFMVSLNQSYYTMSFDLPTSLDKLFDPSVTPSDLNNYVGENNPATYISSVTYGRIFYMLIESSSSQSELETAVNTAFSGITVDVDATLEINHFSSLENVTYSVFAYGGDAGSTFGAIGVTNINTLVEVLKQSSTLGSAKPLSYVVRNVSNNQIVATQLATSYDVVECEQVGAVGTLPSISHWTNHPLINDFGSISAAYADSKDEFVLMNKREEYLISRINQNGDGILEGPFILADFPLSSVGAASRVKGPGENLFVFNEAGNKYSVLKSNGSWSQIFDISDYFNGGCPFINTGIGALAHIGTLPVFGTSHYMFDKSGLNFVLSTWEEFFGTHFLEVDSVDSGFGLGGKLNGVGAVIGFENGSSSDSKYVFILFNLSGTEYMIWGDFGNGPEARGPFSIYFFLRRHRALLWPCVFIYY